MKKLIALLVVVFALLSLSSCSHTHTIDEWSVDYLGHWHICTECGEKINYTVHVNQTGYEFNSGDVCIVCNSSVTINKRLCKAAKEVCIRQRSSFFSARGTMILPLSGSSS